MAIEINVPTTDNADPAAQAAKDAAFLARAEGKEIPKAEEKPEENLILGKFKTAEDLAKAYTELEKKLGATKEEKKDDASLKVETPTDGPEGNEEAQKALEAKGLDFDAYKTEVLNTGDLSAESREKIIAAGIPAEAIDAYMTGLYAQRDAYMNDMYSAAGGAESYQEMVKWAAANLPKAEIEAFNAALDAAPGVAKLAISGLYGKFKASGEVVPSLLGGGAAGATGDVYLSQAQLIADQKKPEYRKDPAFRAAVQAKLMRSNI